MASAEQKIAAARAALDDVRAGMKLGLGTGSTSEEFVKLLAASPMAAHVRCTCTSKRTEELAKELGLAVFGLAELSPLDLAVDGADEIDSALRLVKGRGGALLREKIVEQQAARFIVIVDESKVVERLGVGPLPIEVTPFAVDVLMGRLEALELEPVLRMVDGAARITDEGNRIIDVQVPQQSDIAEVVANLRAMAGVVETGFFPDEATEAIIAGGDGMRRIKR